LTHIAGGLIVDLAGECVVHLVGRFSFIKPVNILFTKPVDEIIYRSF